MRLWMKPTIMITQYNRPKDRFRSLLAYGFYVMKFHVSSIKFFLVFIRKNKYFCHSETGESSVITCNWFILTSCAFLLLRIDWIMKRLILRKGSNKCHYIVISLKKMNQIIKTHTHLGGKKAQQTLIIIVAWV